MKLVLNAILYAILWWLGFSIVIGIFSAFAYSMLAIFDLLGLPPLFCGSVFIIFSISVMVYYAILEREEKNGSNYY